MVLADECLLRAVKTHQNSHQIDLLILDSLLGLVLLNRQDLPLLCRVLVLLAAHLLDVLLRRDLHDLPGQLRVILNIISKGRDDTPKGVVSLEEVILDGQGDLLKDDALGIDDLQNLQHVDVLVEDVLSDHSWNQQALLYFSAQILADLGELGKGRGTSGARSRHFLRLVMVL